MAFSETVLVTDGGAERLTRSRAPALRALKATASSPTRSARYRPRLARHATISASHRTSRPPPRVLRPRPVTDVRLRSRAHSPALSRAPAPCVLPLASRARSPPRRHVCHRGARRVAVALGTPARYSLRAPWPALTRSCTLALGCARTLSRARTRTACSLLARRSPSRSPRALVRTLRSRYVLSSPAPRARFPPRAAHHSLSRSPSLLPLTPPRPTLSPSPMRFPSRDHNSH